MNDQKCAPTKKFENGSCFTLDNLKIIANEFNKKYEKKIDIKDDKKYLLKQLVERLSDKCNTQHCWLTLDFVKSINNNDILKNTFLPLGPSGTKWLDTSNIDNTLYQYEIAYNDFKSFGAHPIDFDDLSYTGIKNINFDELFNKGIYRIGFVFNLDEHYKSGSHWVALYANIKNPQIYYYDSYGHKPPKRVRILMARIANWCNKSNDIDHNNLFQFTKFPIKYNKKRHQFKNSECGVFSISFILRLLKGISFDDIEENKKQINDDVINKCRNVYFTHKEDSPTK